MLADTMDSIWYEREEKSVDHIYFLGRDGSVTYEDNVMKGVNNEKKFMDFNCNKHLHFIKRN